MVVLFCGVVVGVIFGLRFRMLIMFPAMLVAAVGLVAQGVWNGRGFGLIAFSSLEAAISLQIGYLVGCGITVYRVGRATARPVWHDKAGAHPDELIFRSEPDSRGERDQWVLVRDLESGEQCVRHDRVTLDKDCAGAPYVRSGPTVPITDFLETAQPLKVKSRLISMLSHAHVEKS